MPLRCDLHGFVCSVPSEMNKHFGEVEHEHNSVTDCQDCGKKNVEVKYFGKLHGGKAPPARCEECITRLRRELNV